MAVVQKYALPSWMGGECHIFYLEETLRRDSKDPNSEIIAEPGFYGRYKADSTDKCQSVEEAKRVLESLVKDRIKKELGALTIEQTRLSNFASEIYEKGLTELTNEKDT